MNFIKEYWYVLLALVILCICIVAVIVEFFKLPRSEQKKNVTEWLKYAVALAEKKLGSGTGQLKLRMVYDAFVVKFPALVSAISFETFSKWVDEALVWFNGQLEANDNVKKFVLEGETNEIGPEK